MEIIRHLLDISIGSFLAAREWREVEPPPGSPFLGIPGGGGVKSVYQRAWWPSLVRLLLYGLPFLLFIAFILVVAFSLNEFLAGAISPDDARWVQLGLVAAALVLGFFLAKNQVNTWPGRTPRSVAVLGSGLAWMEGDTLHFWSWEQVKAVRNKDYFLVIENQSGQAARFHSGLGDMPFGIRARMACRQ